MEKKHKKLKGQPHDADWRRTNDAAAEFDVSRTTLNNWREDERVRWTRIGGTIYYDVASIEAIRTANTHEIAV